MGSGETVFFVGSGISLPAPAGLPLFGHVRSAILDGLDDGLKARTRLLAPEILLRALDLATRGRLADELTNAFSAGQPRPALGHYVLAHRLLAGDLIWTTNYDTLIEQAAEFLRGARAAEVAASMIRKPHGTFVRDLSREGQGGRWNGHSGLVFTAEHVVMDWPLDSSEQLAQDVDGRHLVLVGYSGVDVNSYRALRAAVQLASQVTWVFLDGGGAPAELSENAFRFPELGERSRVLVGNPSLWLSDQFGLDLDLEAVPDRDLVLEARVDGVSADLARLTRLTAPPLVQARIARELGERRAERDLTRLAVRQGLGALAHYVRLTRHSPPIQRSRSFVRHRYAKFADVIPATDRTRSRLFADSPSDGPADALARVGILTRWVAEATDSESRTRLRLELARHLRYLGRYAEAAETAGLALAEARSPKSPLPTEAGRAAFELLEALRNKGDFHEAFEVIRFRLETLAMGHWTAWSDYERGCIHLQMRNTEEGRKSLVRASEFFGSAVRDVGATSFDPVQGSAFIGLGLSLCARLEGEVDRSDHELAQTVEAHPNYVDSPLMASLLSFHRAESLRVRSRYDEAWSHYDQMDPRIENFGGLRWLGTALCAVGTGADVEAPLTRALAEFTRVGSGFGLAYCEGLSASTGLRLSTTVNDDLPRPTDVVTRPLVANTPIAFT